MNNRITFGYEVRNGRVEINQEQASDIRDIFNTYIKCNSFTETSKLLGCKYKSPRIRAIIMNSAYLGNDYWPAIIDKDTFDKAQELRIKKAKEVGKHNMPRKIKEIKVTSTFSIGKVPIKYEDPYLQAEFAYSQIKENKNE